MEPRVERKAKELAQALAESDTYAKLNKAQDEVQQHSAAQIMLRDVQERQEKLAEKSRNGEKIEQAEIDQLQQVSQVAAMNPYVRQLLEAQMEFEAMFSEIQVMMAKAVGIDVEGPPAEDEEEATREPAPNEGGSSARSRLWVPGKE